jgi:hypothetical protein
MGSDLFAGVPLGQKSTGKSYAEERHSSLREGHKLKQEWSQPGQVEPGRFSAWIIYVSRLNICISKLHIWISTQNISISRPPISRQRILASSHHFRMSKQQIHTFMQRIRIYSRYNLTCRQHRRISRQYSLVR